MSQPRKKIKTARQNRKRKSGSFFDPRRFTPAHRRHFFINLAIGVVIIVLFHWLQSTQWGEATLDKFFDLFIRSESRKAMRQQRALAETDLVFIDIDQQTYEQWGEPLITPRDKLASVIEQLRHAEIRIIVLDILLENPDCRVENDERLLSALKRIQEDGKGGCKIVLPRRLASTSKPKRSIFDPVLANADPRKTSSHGKLFIASPSLRASGQDDVVRYWNAFDEYIDGGGHKRIIWGYPLVAAMLAMDGDLGRLEALSNRITENPCDTRGIWSTTLDFAGSGKVRVPMGHLDTYLQRIRFLLRPPRLTAADGDEPAEEGNLFQTTIRFDEIGFYQGLLKDKIAIIGNSSPDAGDTHRTPVGEMAGMYILGNALNTILHSRQPVQFPHWLGWLLEVLIVIMAAYLFLHFPSFLAQILASIVILVFCGWLSYLIFRHTGMFLNFTFALAGMGMHEMAADIEEIFTIKGSRNH